MGDLLKISLFFSISNPFFRVVVDFSNINEFLIKIKYINRVKKVDIN